LKHTTESSDDATPSHDPKREYREIEIDQCNAYNAYNAYNHIKEKRDNHCIRLRPSIHTAVKNYCGRDMSIGQFYEEAAILFMDVNPSDRTVLVVERPERPRQNNIKDEMKSFVCLDSMRDFVEKIEEDDTDNLRLLKIRREKFIELLNDCDKIKTWGDELNELIVKARSHFD
jgi:hypothetical protein